MATPLREDRNVGARVVLVPPRLAEAVGLHRAARRMTGLGDAIVGFMGGGRCPQELQKTDRHPAEQQRPLECALDSTIAR